MTAEANLQNETAEEKKKRLAKKKKEEKAAKAAELEKQKQEEDAEKKVLADAQKAVEEAQKTIDKRAAETKEADAKKKKKKKKTTLKDLAEDYNLKQIDGIWVPGYFHRKKRYADNAELKVDVYHANNFLLGMEIFEKQGSCSAKFTYIGPNRQYTLRNVKVGKREARPTHNNWKIFDAPVRMFRGTEHNSKVKDPKVIRDTLTSQGGKQNFAIRFVQDKEFTKEEVKKKVFAKDPVRHRNLNYRIKKDQAKLGIKPTLRNKDEALLLIKDLRKEVKDNRADHVITYLQKEIKKYEVIEKKLAEEAKKD